MGEVFYNSEFINEEEIVIKISNRAFNYGDGFFETIKIINTKPFNFSTHYLRFSFACKVLKLKNNEKEKSLFFLLNKLIKKNKIVNGNAKIHVNRSGEGKYLPFSDSFEILISIHKGSGFVENTPISQLKGTVYIFGNNQLHWVDEIAEGSRWSCTIFLENDSLKKHLL